MNPSFYFNDIKCSMAFFYLFLCLRCFRYLRDFKTRVFECISWLFSVTVSYLCLHMIQSNLPYTCWFGSFYLYLQFEMIKCFFSKRYNACNLRLGRKETVWNDSGYWIRSASVWDQLRPYYIQCLHGILYKGVIYCFESHWLCFT